MTPRSDLISSLAALAACLTLAFLLGRELFR